MKDQVKCRLCGNLFKSGGAQRHISACLQQGNSIISDDITGKAIEKVTNLYTEYMFFHITKSYSSRHHLYILVEQNESFKVLDLFLRAIWVECCNHLSSFNLNGKSFESDSILASEGARMGMDYPIKNFMEKSETMIYEYDFGSTTALRITMVEDSIRFQSEQPIVIIGRNVFKGKREASPREGVCGYSYNPDYMNAFEYDYKKYKNSKTNGSRDVSDRMIIQSIQRFEEEDEVEKTVEDVLYEFLMNDNDDSMITMLENELEFQKKKIEHTIKMKNQRFYQNLRSYKNLPELELVLKTLKVKELKELAGTIGIKNRSALRKNELVTVLNNELLKIYGDRLKLMDTGAISLLKRLVAGEGRCSAERRELVEDKKAATEVLFSAFQIVTALNKANNEMEFILPKEIYIILKDVDWAEYEKSEIRNHRIISFMSGYLENYGVMHDMELPYIYANNFSEEILDYDLHGILSLGCATYQSYLSSKDYYYSVFASPPEVLYSEQWRVREYDGIDYKFISTEVLIKEGEADYEYDNPLFDKFKRQAGQSLTKEKIQQLKRIYSSVKGIDEEVQLSIVLYDYKNVLNFKNLKEAYAFGETLIEDIPLWRLLGHSYNEINALESNIENTTTSDEETQRTTLEKEITPYIIKSLDDYAIRTILDAYSIQQLSDLIQNNGIKLDSAVLNKSMLLQIMESVYLQKNYWDKMSKKLDIHHFKILEEMMLNPITMDSIDEEDNVLCEGLILLIKLGMVFVIDSQTRIEFFVADEFKTFIG